jgi:predicted nuclease of predicted toxin-antitoxin system
MTFLVDENMPALARIRLGARGHRVLDIRGTDLEGSPDVTLIELAAREQAVILTTDRDFFHTLPLRYPGHRGIAVIALRRPNTAAIPAALDRVLPELEAEPPIGRSYLVTDGRIYLRQPPPPAG